MSNMNRQDRPLKDTSSPANDSPLTTQAKALALNLDRAKYYGFTEIGGGQEVARSTTFFAFAERGLPGHHGADRKDPGASSMARRPAGACAAALASGRAADPRGANVVRIDAAVRRAGWFN